QALSRCWAPLEAHTSDVDAIKATGAPVLFFCGDGDSYHPNVVRVAGQLGAPMVTVPGANHLTAMMHSELVVPSLLEFFAQASSPPVPAA
ncbi:MAG TPA: hypothetical protein VE990_05775, partial [Acidimicrobiales bacterium]|nr:hypothetical protein [Acidimicrobiales bacterium]